MFTVDDAPDVAAVFVAPAAFAPLVRIRGTPTLPEIWVSDPLFAVVEVPSVTVIVVPV